MDDESNGQFAARMRVKRGGHRGTARSPEGIELGFAMEGRPDRAAEFIQVMRLEPEGDPSSESVRKFLDALGLPGRHVDPHTTSDDEGTSHAMERCYDALFDAHPGCASQLPPWYQRKGSGRTEFIYHRPEGRTDISTASLKDLREVSDEMGLLYAGNAPLTKRDIRQSIAEAVKSRNRIVPPVTLMEQVAGHVRRVGESDDELRTRLLETKHARERASFVGSMGSAHVATPGDLERARKLAVAAGPEVDTLAMDNFMMRNHAETDVELRRRIAVKLGIEDMMEAMGQLETTTAVDRFDGLDRLLTEDDDKANVSSVSIQRWRDGIAAWTAPPKPATKPVRAGFAWLMQRTLFWAKCAWVFGLVFALVLVWRAL